MNPLVAGTINPWNMTFSWADLTTGNGGDVPIYYQVEWYNPNTSAWNIVSSQSMGKYLTFTHYRIPYIYPSNSNQVFRVLAMNNVGFGTTYSTNLTMVADREP